MLSERRIDMHMTNTSQSGPGRCSWQRELSRILWKRRWPLGALILINVLGPALEPAQSWIAKVALDKLTGSNATMLRTDLIGLLPMTATAFIVLATVRMISHVLDRVLDAQLKIDMQRFYFDRRLKQVPAEDVSRMIYDCEQARKMVDILQKDMWVVVIGLPAVIVWQLKLSADWVTPLVLAALPAMLLTLVLGPAVRRWSGRRLESIAAISSAVCGNDREQLCDGQTAFFHSSVRFEVCKKATEVLTDLMLWLGLAFLLLFAWFVPIFPEKITGGDLAAFLVNLKLLSKPLQELGKLYMKAHECHPAVQRVFVRQLSADAIVASSR